MEKKCLYIVALTVLQVVSNPGPYQELINEITIAKNLSDAYERPSLSEAINNTTSCFRKELKGK